MQIHSYYNDNMTAHYRNNRWPTNTTVLTVGSMKPKLALEISFGMPKPGPKRRLPLSSSVFEELLHSPDQGHLALGIRPEALNLPSVSMHQLLQAIGGRGCEHIIGVIMPEELWERVELHSDKLWRMPVALVQSSATYRALIPGVLLEDR